MGYLLKICWMRGDNEVGNVAGRSCVTYFLYKVFGSKHFKITEMTYCTDERYMIKLKKEHMFGLVVADST